MVENNPLSDPIFKVRTGNNGEKLVKVPDNGVIYYRRVVNSETKVVTLIPV